MTSSSTTDEDIKKEVDVKAKADAMVEAEEPKTPKGEIDLLSTKDLVDDSLLVWWMVVEFDDNGAPLNKWILMNSQIFFLKHSRAIGFLDHGQNVVILKKNFTFTIIRIGDWTHPDYFKYLYESEEIDESDYELESPKDDKKEKEKELIVNLFA